MKKILNTIKNHKWIIPAAVVITAALVVAFIAGSSKSQSSLQPQSATFSVETLQSEVGTSAAVTVAPSESISSSTAAATTVQASTASGAASTTAPSFSASEPNEQRVINNTPTNAAHTEKAEAGTEAREQTTASYAPEPVAPEEQTTSDDKIKCVFSVSCASILRHTDMLDPEKAELVPSDGWIIKPETVELSEGESVFDVLKRECREKNIHLAFRWTPIYNSVYVEGINNIYEMDCGSSSGWTYYINDYFPNFGMSQYVPKNGDNIKICYSCVMSDREELLLWSGE